MNGDSNPSVIQGALRANGTIYLINQNGIIFDQGSQVNVQGLVASTLGLNATNGLDFFHNGDSALLRWLRRWHRTSINADVWSSRLYSLTEIKAHRADLQRLFRACNVIRRERFIQEIGNMCDVARVKAVPQAGTAFCSRRLQDAVQVSVNTTIRRCRLVRHRSSFYCTGSTSRGFAPLRIAPRMCPRDCTASPIA